MKTVLRICAALLTASTLILPTAARAVNVTYDGTTVCEGKARLIESSTYVPLRSFSDAFGVSEITWDGKNAAAHARADGLALRAAVGDEWIEVNGRAFHAPDGVRLIDGVLMVPLRPLARAYGLDVTWDASTDTAQLSRTGSGFAAPAEAVYDTDELYWLSRIISAESRGEPFLGQLAVGNVVLNRVASPDFPDTVYDVIFDRKYAIQFTPVANGTIYSAPTLSAVIAAKLALEGYSVSRDALYFLNPAIATSFWITQNRPFAFRIGTHEFYT